MESTLSRLSNMQEVPMFVLAYRYCRTDDTRIFHSAECGQSLRITAPARLVCKWHNSAQGPLVCTWRRIGPKQSGASR
jgi:hypothetical protein